MMPAAGRDGLGQIINRSDWAEGPKKIFWIEQYYILVGHLFNSVLLPPLEIIPCSKGIFRLGELINLGNLRLGKLTYLEISDWDNP